MPASWRRRRIRELEWFGGFARNNPRCQENDYACASSSSDDGRRVESVSFARLRSVLRELLHAGRPGLHDVLRSGGALLRCSPVRRLLRAAGLHDVLCGAVHGVLWADRCGLSRVLREARLERVRRRRGSTWQGSPSETSSASSLRNGGRRRPESKRVSRRATGIHGPTSTNDRP